MKDTAFNKIWKLSPNVSQTEYYQELVQLTQQIINEYKDQGRIDINPLESSRKRELSLPVDLLNDKLTNATCIVTGGLGCIGSTLVTELLQFDVHEIIVIDKVDHNGIPLDERITYCKCDILDEEALAQIFSKHNPQIVFHTAAQRNPGLAEQKISETIDTNVFGTLNMVRAAENTPSVRHFVFSSTGKASRYFTEEIYAATKKICEYLLEVTSKESSIIYSMARFTHIVDNSLMDREVHQSVLADPYVKIHNPGKFVTAQNAKEAAYLLLNALIYCDEKKCNFLLVRYLEWPVESLELALYYISTFKKSIPIIFIGNPLGYTEKFFRGQMDWSKPADLNLLINVYENRFRRLNEEGDIIISNILECSGTVLNRCLDNLRSATSDQEARSSLIAGLKDIVKETLVSADKRDTVSILNWGLDKKILEVEHAKAEDYGPIIPLLFQSLEGTPYFNQIEHLLEF